MPSAASRCSGYFSASQPLETESEHQAPTLVIAAPSEALLLHEVRGFFAFSPPVAASIRKAATRRFWSSAKCAESRVAIREAAKLAASVMTSDRGRLSATDAGQGMEGGNEVGRVAILGGEQSR